MKDFLTPEQRELLKSQHKKERDKKVCDRIKAVLLFDEGWTHVQIAHVLLLSDEAVRLHIFDYLTSQKLKPESGGSEEKLSKDQAGALEKHLETYTYLHIKEIIAYVKAVYDVKYSISGMNVWLIRHGFSYKKPALVPGKANAKAQQEWINGYEDLKAKLPSDETICFIDGVHPTHNTLLAYGWIKTGVRKEIASNSGRSRLNLSGALDLKENKLHIREDKTLNAESTIAFFKQIETAYPDKKTIHIFLDNARYYKNKEVQNFLETSKIKLRFLPPYSPNLNPIERLWKFMKEKVLYNTYYEYFDDFRQSIILFLQQLSNLDPLSELGRAFATRVRDNFRLQNAPATNF